MPEGVVLIGGSTASGKSALALALAERTGGVILNADSVQLYRDLPILTARPGPAELARAEHRLYGVLEAHEQGSVADWLERIEGELRALEGAGRLAIVTGGTGLYFKALLEGLPLMPDIPKPIRQELRASPEPAAALHRRLQTIDPALAATLAPGDRQRILRGLEVVMATGRPLSAWQALPPRRLRLASPLVGIALLPPAEIVDPRIAARLEAMLAAGLLDELRAFRRGPGRHPTPLGKADGVAEFGHHLAGAIDLASAKAQARLKIRRYAKRQRTFFRGQLGDVLRAVPDVAEGAGIDRLCRDLMAQLEAPGADARAVDSLGTSD